MRRCAVCGNQLAASQRLCTTCKADLVRYREENPTWMAAYVEAGFAELGAYLGRHAAFSLYLESNPPKRRRAA